MHQMQRLVGFVICLALTATSESVCLAAAKVNPLGLKAHHITAAVDDLDRAIHWYQDTLGFNLRNRGARGRMQYAELSIGSFGVALVKLPGASPTSIPLDSSSPHWVHMVFAVRDAAAAFQQLKDRGVNVHTRDSLQGPIESFLLNDSEGNEIEIISDRPDA